MRVCKECGIEFKRNRREQVFCGRRCANIDRARRREKARESLRQYSVWSCGAGVQSTAIAVLIIQGKLPKPDFAIMTDCGYEPSYILDHVHNRLVPELSKVGVRLHVVNASEYVDTGLFSATGLLAIPAYAEIDGKVAQYRTYCSSRFKIQPAMRWIKEQGVERCVNWLGVSIDETRRARVSRRKWIEYRYPLIELGMDRDACAWLIGQHGWPRPERSSCVMCGQRPEVEWERMRRLYPSDYEWARQIERDIQEREPGVYLRRTLESL